jgi:hypothetical protein
MPRARFNLRRPAVCWQAIRLGGRTRRNAKARSERAFAERFEGGSKRLSNMAHPAGFELRAISTARFFELLVPSH